MWRLWEESFNDPQLQFKNVDYMLEAYSGSGSSIPITAQAPVKAFPHTAYVLLAQNSAPQAQYIYSAYSDDPLLLCSVKHAIVTNIRNDSGYKILLAHGGPRVDFYQINIGGSTSIFNNMKVEGNWTAEVLEIDIKKLPLRITIIVDWAFP